jgi:hypothetical protein
MVIHFIGPTQDCAGICVIAPQTVVPAVDEAELAVLALEESRGGSLGEGLDVLGE